MQRNKTFLISCIAVLMGVAVGSGASAADAPTPAQVVPGSWQHHQVRFTYYGITSLYSCSGLETDVKSILLNLGARKDAKVDANGCPRGPDVPSHNAIVDTDFYTLVPQADAGAAGEKSVPSYWAKVIMDAHRPYFMGHGQCELMGDMKDLITKNFSLRDLDYQTNCVPHEITLNDFSIKAQVLKPTPSVARSSN